MLLFEESDYQVVREIASDVRKEFVDKIWSNSHLVLAMSVILDPRFKMDTVKHWYKEIYGGDAEKNLKIFIDYVNNVYVKYVSSCSNSSNPDKLLDHLGRPCSKLELDWYLKEPKFPSVEEFDILAWWRVNTPNFPILAKMALDFLAIPFAVSDYTMMSEVKYYWVRFDHSRYDDDGILQVIVCTKMWLENP
ncbi:hypothetical protein LWI29_009481 [Acer saccharum]|uniref:HAT C-terminal dimerisation domain-containing protein n=1 Tax=Acer saccharum TaxID=4024 RepID=A0AA39TMW5_ACESA|nr:hypothetical protein LWI29_009481 [Acer saccharum]